MDSGGTTDSSDTQDENLGGWEKPPNDEAMPCDVRNILFSVSKTGQEKIQNRGPIWAVWVPDPADAFVRFAR